MEDQPTGVLTFLFTDIEGSTRRWQQAPDAMRDALGRHDAIMAACVEGRGGKVFKHTGDGVCAVFRSATGAVQAAVDIQRAIAGNDWDGVGGLRVRMGVHTGEASERNDDYFGPALNRVARLMGVAHGEQILLSSTTAALLEPDPADVIELKDLGEQVLRDIERPDRVFQATAPGLRADFPPLRTGGSPAQNLPARRSSFIGRAGEIDQIAGVLGEVSLVTLVGIGGTGKTRLALEVAHGLTHRFDSVVFCDLSPLADGQQVLAAVASVCGISGAGAATGPLLTTVIATLNRRPTLVVLDNCEHLLEDCAALVDELLAACPELVLLATSREALGVEGERSWPVSSLPPSEARALFLDRALAADPGFRATPDRESVIDEICWRLDGIPLAIELAAARIGHLSPEELASRLDDRFRLLTGGRRRRTQRQHTLRAAIDWSYDLLSPAEATLFARLSVFSGGFTLEACEAVCVDDLNDAAGVLDLLASLVSKSLVVAERAGSDTRYRMLETIRMYAADKLLEAGEVERRRQAHHDYFRLRVARLDVDSRGATIPPVLLAEIDNMRAAIDWSEARDHPEQALELATELGALWTAVELQEEGAALIARLLEDPRVSDAQRARGLAVLSSIHMARAEFRDMARAGRRSIALDPGTHWSSLAYTLAALYLVFNPTRYEEAHQLFSDARRVAQQHGQPHMAELASAIEAHFWLLEGDHDRPVELARSLKSRGTISEANAVVAAGVALILRGDPEPALGMAERLLGSGGDVWSGPLRACTLVEMGRAGDAENLLRDSVAEFLDHPYPLIASDFLIAAAALATRQDPSRAVELLEAVVSERGQASFRSPAMFLLWNRYRDQAREHLGESAYEEARGRSGRLSVSEALRREADRLALHH